MGKRSPQQRRSEDMMREGNYRPTRESGTKEPGSAAACCARGPFGRSIGGRAFSFPARLKLFH